jgi:hypothetical protein
MTASPHFSISPVCATRPLLLNQIPNGSPGRGGLPPLALVQVGLFTHAGLQADFGNFGISATWYTQALKLAHQGSPKFALAKRFILSIIGLLFRPWVSLSPIRLEASAMTLCLGVCLGSSTMLSAVSSATAVDSGIVASFLTIVSPEQPAIVAIDKISNTYFIRRGLGLDRRGIQRRAFRKRLGLRQSFRVRLSPENLLQARHLNQPTCSGQANQVAMRPKHKMSQRKTMRQLPRAFVNILSQKSR